MGQEVQLRLANENHLQVSSKEQTHFNESGRVTASPVGAFVALQSTSSALVCKLILVF
jgi:hypothetical protein